MAPETTAVERIPPRRPTFHERREEPISHQEATEAALRLIHSHFGTKPHARISIPMRLDDDDIVLLDYIHQQAVKEIGP